MRNKPYVAALAVPALLLLIWAFSLWWNENGVMSLIVGGVAAALGFGAYRVAQASSFAPTGKTNWSGARSAGVNTWLDAQDAKDGRPAAKQ